MARQWPRARARSSDPARSSITTRAIYAAQVADPDGYTLEFVFKSWQH